MIIEDEDLLKAWISRDVEPLTDAEADALAKYVLALVKKPLSDSDLENLCLDKLNVFLQNHTRGFVDRLFRCLRESQYLPEDANNLQKTSQQITPHVLNEEINDNLSDDEEMENEINSVVAESNEKRIITSSFSGAKSPIKQSTDVPTKSDSPSNSSRPVRRRISPPVSTTNSISASVANNSDSKDRYNRSQRSPIRGDRSLVRSSRRNISTNYTSSRGSRSDRYHRRRNSRSRSKSRSRSPYRKDHDGSSRRVRCRDFHEKGFCMRGDKCVYDHGPDPVVIENSALEKIVNRNVAGNTTNTAAVYNPINPPPPGVEKNSYGGNVTEAYNPEAPAITSQTKLDFSIPPPPLYPTVANPNLYANPSSTLLTVVPTVASGNSYNPNLVTVQPQQDPTAYIPYNSIQAHSIGNIGGLGTLQQTAQFARRGYRGGQRFKPYVTGNRIDPALCSLLVKKIPPEQNKIVLLDQHFGKFGQITNLHVQFEGQSDTALVTFKTRREALNAFKSTEPIFNNRFIKVFWQNQPQEQVTTSTENTQNECQEGAPIASITMDTLKTVNTQPPANRIFSKVFNNASNKDSTNNENTHQNEAVKNLSKMDSPAMSLVADKPHPPSTQVFPNPGEVAAKQRKADKEALQRLLDLHRLKMEIYNKQIEQQTGLLKKIQATQNKEIKRKFMALVKKTEESTKTTKMEIEELSKQISGRQEVLKQSQNLKWIKKDDGNSSDRDNEGLKHVSDDLKNENNESGEELNLQFNKNLKKAQFANTKKRYLVLMVYGCPVEAHTELIMHMEKFGELFDFDITSRSINSPCVFTYKKVVDAQKALAEGAENFAHAHLKVEWAPSALGNETEIVPDLKRKPDQQITPAALLASIDYDEEEDDEEGAPEED